jgi:hydrogenase maturation protease
MKTLVIGLGNPILGDDGVGWKVAEEVSSVISYQSSVDGDTIEVDTAAQGGLSLMERLIGYERVIIVDSMETGNSPVGSVSVFPLASLPDPMAGHSASTHDATLMTALRTAEQLGTDIPKQVDIVAIEAENVYDFSEELSPTVAAAVPLAVLKVVELLNSK